MSQPERRPSSGMSAQELIQEGTKFSCICSFCWDGWRWTKYRPKHV